MTEPLPAALFFLGLEFDNSQTFQRNFSNISLLYLSMQSGDTQHYSKMEAITLTQLSKGHSSERRPEYEKTACRNRHYRSCRNHRWRFHPSQE